MTEDKKVGEVFTRYYAPDDAPLSSDGLRFRNRLSALVDHFWPEMPKPTDFVKREVGIEIQDGEYRFGWDKFIKEGQLGDVLDVITALFSPHYSPGA